MRQQHTHTHTHSTSPFFYGFPTLRIGRSSFGVVWCVFVQGESIGERLSKLSHGAGPSRRKRHPGNNSGEQKSADATRKVGPLLLALLTRTSVNPHFVVPTNPRLFQRWRLVASWTGNVCHLTPFARPQPQAERDNARAVVVGGKGKTSGSGRPKAHSRANKNRPQEVRLTSVRGPC